ncbi:Nucleic acid-binding, OB-fold [Sesbania bispinosa]|nr:Nucleic acid-binding, OB-fold [Sesbania bispinosa]
MAKLTPSVFKRKSTMSAVSRFFIPVKDISPYSEPWFIEVKLIRMWTTPICSNVSHVNIVEMVFIDLEGTKIQGSVTRVILRHKRLEMDEGGFYELNEALVVPNEGNDRPTQHAYRLLFQARSLIKKIEPLSFNALGLSPMTSAALASQRFVKKFLVDKVVLLTSVSCERDYIKDDKDITAVLLELTDPMGKIECVLYDDYVQDLREYQRREGPMTPIIVVQFARVVPVGQVMLGELIIE